MSFKHSRNRTLAGAERRALVKGAAVLPFISPLQVFAQTATRPLPIPPIVDGTQPENGRTQLILRDGRHDFGTGFRNKTKGINQDYLGPIVRVKKDIPFTVRRQLSWPAYCRN